MSARPAALERLYELLASGQLEIPHGQAERFERWLATVLPPGAPIGAFARAEAMRLEPHLVLMHRPGEGARAFCIEGRFGHRWGEASTWRDAWIQALVSCWRTLAWRARRDMATAKAEARGRRAA